MLCLSYYENECVAGGEDWLLVKFKIEDFIPPDVYAQTPQKSPSKCTAQD